MPEIVLVLNLDRIDLEGVARVALHLAPAGVAYAALRVELKVAEGAVGLIVHDEIRILGAFGAYELGLAAGYEPAYGHVQFGEGSLPLAIHDLIALGMAINTDYVETYRIQV